MSRLAALSWLLVSLAVAADLPVARPLAVTAARRPATTLVDVGFTVPGPDSAWVVFEASADGGRTWDVPVLSIAGDVGRVAPGAGRAVWDAGIDAGMALLAAPWAVRALLSPTPPVPAGADRVRVPAGLFAMGSDDGDPHERPLRQVRLHAYWIDRYETTNRAFQYFVQSTGRQTLAEREGCSVVYRDGGYHTLEGASWRHPDGPGSDLSGRLDHPVVQVTWDEADAYCAWAGKRLPTEAEWERAARGTDGRTYPWGEATPDADGVFRANYGQNSCCHESAADGHLHTAAVGSFPAGRSPTGADDMAGNAWEWTADLYAPYVGQPEVDARSAAERVLRGGSWVSHPFRLRAAYRGRHTPDTRHNYGGFRCAGTGT